VEPRSLSLGEKRLDERLRPVEINDRGDLVDVPIRDLAKQ
jgi:hypothetical protein